MAFGRGRRKAVVDAPFEELPDEDVALTGTMEMVLERGNVKHLHFDGVELRSPAPEPVRQVEAPESAPLAFDEVAEPSRVPRSARPLYETDRGNQVLAYDGEGRRQFATTSPHGERPFDPESDVDPLIRNVALEERRVVREEVVDVVASDEEPTPSEHVYREVIPVHTKPAPVQPTVVEEAWEPGAPTKRVVLRETAPRARPARKPKIAKPATKPAKKKARKPRVPHSDFPGDDHLVIDIEGIGPIYAKRLQKEGVYTSSRLRFEKAGPLAKRIKAPRKVVKKWQAMAEMMKAKGIGPQYAEVMARVGVKGIDDLKKREPKTLAKKVTKYLASLDSSVIGSNVKEGRAKAWIKAAQKMRRRPIPVPRKGPPETETVKGFIEKVVPYGGKAKPAKRAAKARKAAKRPVRKGRGKKR
ncbi:MAG: DUF4332 domain-containing protein [Candidatus Thermoplasmatota archaeon]